MQRIQECIQKEDFSELFELLEFEIKKDFNKENIHILRYNQLMCLLQQNQNQMSIEYLKKHDAVLKQNEDYDYIKNYINYQLYEYKTILNSDRKELNYLILKAQAYNKTKNYLQSLKLYILSIELNQQQKQINSDDLLINFMYILTQCILQKGQLLIQETDFKLNKEIIIKLIKDQIKNVQEKIDKVTLQNDVIINLLNLIQTIEKYNLIDEFQLQNEFDFIYNNFNKFLNQIKQQINLSSFNQDLVIDFKNSDVQDYYTIQNIILFYQQQPDSQFLNLCQNLTLNQITQKLQISLQKQEINLHQFYSIFNLYSFSFNYLGKTNIEEMIAVYEKLKNVFNPNIKEELIYKEFCFNLSCLYLLNNQISESKSLFKQYSDKQFDIWNLNLAIAICIKEKYHNLFQDKINQIKKDQYNFLFNKNQEIIYYVSQIVFYHSINNQKQLQHVFKEFITNLLIPIIKEDQYQ